MQKRTKKGQWDHIKAFGFFIPVLLVFTIFVFTPFFKTLYLSFFEWNLISPKKTFVGLSNYIALFQDPVTVKVLSNTFVYILIMLVVNFIVPYIMSYMMAIMLKKGQNFYKGAIFLPYVISLVVGSILYLWILNPVSGPIGLIARTFGIRLPIWSKTDGLVLLILSLITSWKLFGYNFIVLFAAVNNIPKEIIEVAKLDGISNWHIFKDIVTPMSSATGIYVLIITIVQGLQQGFTPIKVVTQGGPNYGSASLTYQSYHEAFTLYHIGKSSALSVLTMVLFMVLLALEFYFVERNVYYEN